MNADILLARLRHVRSTGPESWRADCPNGHQHARGSLAITRTGDGCILLHCFACGDVHGILAALGLEISELFPARIKDTTPEGRRRAREAFTHCGWQAALRVLGRESTCVLVAADMLAHGEALSADDYKRLNLAKQRIDDARAVLT